MATAPTSNEPTTLKTGDRMDQPTFDALYEMTPQGFKAELIEGTVYVSCPVGTAHARAHSRVAAWLTRYAEATPGTDAYLDNTTIIDDQNEPQPDASLIVKTSHGGQTREQRDRLFGPSELVIEVANSTRDVDLGAKYRAYERVGVREYLVVAVYDDTLHWFTARNGHFEPIDPGPDGLLRSAVFPGLWLDPAVFFEAEYSDLLAPVRRGLATPEHAAFVARLAEKRATT